MGQGRRACLQAKVASSGCTWSNNGDAHAKRGHPWVPQGNQVPQNTEIRSCVFLTSNAVTTYWVKNHYHWVCQWRAHEFNGKVGSYVNASPLGWSEPYLPARPAICFAWVDVSCTIFCPSNFIRVLNTIRLIFLEGGEKENVKKFYLEVNCNVVHLAKNKQKMTRVFKSQIKTQFPWKSIKETLRCGVSDGTENSILKVNSHFFLIWIAIIPTDFVKCMRTLVELKS